MALPPRDTDPAWTSIVAAAAEKQMTGKLNIYGPSTSVPYDPITDTGGSDTPNPILTDIPARCVFIQDPQSYGSTIDWTVKREARVQIPRSHFGTPILKGYVIRFTDGGDDPELPSWSFEVLGAGNGTLAAVRTILCMSSLTVTPAVA